MKRAIYPIHVGVFVMLSMAVEGLAQTTFNVVQHNANMLGSQGRSIFEQEGGYLFFSVEWASDSSSTALFTSRLDLEGNLIGQHEFRTGRHVDPGVTDPICQSGDKYVAAVNSFSSNGEIPRATFLYWFNAEGDTIRTRFFRSDSASEGNIGSQQLVALPDGGFLHCGWCGDPINTGCITRLDSTGTILWERLYTNTNAISKATPLADGGFILGGTQNGQFDNAVVMRTDSLGAPQWTRYYGAYGNTGGGRALEAANGDILVPGAWRPTVVGPGQIRDRWASLFRYDAQGNSPTRKDYFWSYLASTKAILPKDETHYWLVGGMFQYGVDPDGVMLLFELDESLDSLWMRRYWYYEPDDAESFVYSVRSTSDGGLVMCGITRQGVTDPRPYLTSNWLLKLDSHGCLVPGCHTVGVQEYVLGLNERLRVSPNPVAQGGPLRVAFEAPPGFSPQGALRVVVLDGLGREVAAEQFSGNGSELVLKAPLGAGLYYLHLRDEQKWLAGAKIIVE
ncbi:MAG: hypothetical protein KF797_04280 [Flavobacteriales bacterium]|nr:hypothetical protein [Flavobacteriales bacterium]